MMTNLWAVLNLEFTPLRMLKDSDEKLRLEMISKAKPLELWGYFRRVQ